LPKGRAAVLNGEFQVTKSGTLSDRRAQSFAQQRGSLKELESPGPADEATVRGKRESNSLKTLAARPEAGEEKSEKNRTGPTAAVGEYDAKLECRHIRDF